VKDIFICMDDSGKFNINEHYCVFAGLVFIGQSARSIFMNNYKAIDDRIKCNYCKQKKTSCNNICPEIKSNIGLKYQDRRQLLRLIEKEITYAAVIKNDNVYKDIINDKASRGRYTDYVQKRIVKQVIDYLLKKGMIESHDDVHIHLFLDEQPTISNGYYNLADSVKEELKYGIFNFNYRKKFDPILFGELSVTLKYRDSKLFYDVQAADIIAGTVRKNVIDASKNTADKMKYLHSLADIYLIFP